MNDHCSREPPVVVDRERASEPRPKKLTHACEIVIATSKKS